MALLALFTLGYVVGVWTACAVFKKPRRESEQAVATSQSGVPVIVLASALQTEVARP